MSQLSTRSANVDLMLEAGLRERKKLRARQQLIDAAFRLFTKRGFDATTVADVAAAVEMSPRTFHRYFESKEDVVLEWFDRGGDALVEGLKERPAGEDPFASLRHVIIELVSSLEGEREHLLACERLNQSTATVRARKHEMMAAWAHRLAAVIVQREKTGGLPKARALLLSSVAMAILQSVQETWTASGGKGSLAKHVEEAFEVFQASSRTSGRTRSAKLQR
jgi:AcrR family transcriptional regulator